MTFRTCVDEGRLGVYAVPERVESRSVSTKEPDFGRRSGGRGRVGRVGSPKSDSQWRSLLGGGRNQSPVRGTVSKNVRDMRRKRLPK